MRCILQPRKFSVHKLGLLTSLTFQAEITCSEAHHCIIYWQKERAQ
jgi:hypothetical protein